MTDIERIEGSTVPAAYAEKTMGTIVRLHEDLIAEKGKRIALLEKLSAKEQALAEAMAYVALLEAELERAGRAPTWRPVDAWARWTLARSAGGVRVEPPAKAARPEPQRPAASTPSPAAARRSEDWRVW